jgi:hypothetical protein
MLEGTTVARDTSESGLGSQLEAFLDAAENAGLKIGPRERLSATALAAELASRGWARTFRDLKASLCALLARSPEEREIFTRLFRLFEPPSKLTPDPPSHPPSGHSNCARGSGRQVQSPRLCWWPSQSAAMSLDLVPSPLSYKPSLLPMYLFRLHVTSLFSRPRPGRTNL